MKMFLYGGYSLHFRAFVGAHKRTLFTSQALKGEPLGHHQTQTHLLDN